MTEAREMTKRNLERALNKVIENYMKIYDEYYETGSRDSAFLKDLADAINNDYYDYDKDDMDKDDFNRGF